MYFTYYENLVFIKYVICKISAFFVAEIILHSIMKTSFKILSFRALLTADLLFMAMMADAQAGGGNGAAALSATATTIRGYATAAQTIVLALGVVIGLVGGVRVYSKMHNGDPDTQKAMFGWFGASLFLVAVGTILTAFFG